MTVAILLFYSAFVLGQGTSPTPQQKTNAPAATTDQKSQNADSGESGAHGHQSNNIEILSDTQGVDFGPYVQRMLETVRKNWYSTIPVSAQWKRGTVIIEFAIAKDGSVRGIKLVPSSDDVFGFIRPSSSGDATLDRAALAGITSSEPFPPLPKEFGGQYLALRVRFYYNPEKSHPTQR